MKKKDVFHYSVEEWEGPDGSCSYEFKTELQARKHMKKTLENPSWGVRKVKLWSVVLLDEEKVKNPKIPKKGG